MGARGRHRRGQAGYGGGFAAKPAPSCRLRARSSPPRSRWRRTTARARSTSWTRSRCPTQPDLAQNYWWLRGKGAFLTGHPVEGTRAFVERERYLTDPASLRASRDELFALIRSAAERGMSLKPPPKTDPIVAGWLALGPVAVEMTRNPMRAAAALANWKRSYPAASRQRQRADAGAEPDRRRHRISRSDCAAAAAVGSRRGRSALRCATASSPPISSRIAASRPHLRIYDVAAETVAGAYDMRSTTAPASWSARSPRRMWPRLPP